MPAWSSREVAAAGAVMASMVALGYALSGVPNVELVTLPAFIGGWWLGAGRGAPVAASGEFLFSVLNPQGPALPPVLVTQVAGMTLAAMAGGWVRNGSSSVSNPFHETAWWHMTQRSARRSAGAQICSMPEGTLRAFSAPSFPSRRLRNSHW